MSQTKYNQYDSTVRPPRRWLEACSVDFLGDHTVIDLDTVPAHAGKTVETIRYEDQDGPAGAIAVEPTDVVFVTGGSMTDVLNLEPMTEVPNLRDSGISFELWRALAGDFPEFGRPSVFIGHVPGSVREPFTLTLREPGLFEHVVEVAREEPGNALVTFTESNWLFSIVTTIQPHFANQPDDAKVTWGYSLFPEEHGNRMNKKMENYTGEEILAGLHHHLDYTDRLEEPYEMVTCIPCMIPFIVSQFVPWTPGGRPEVVPARLNDLAFLGQFAEVPDNVVFTIEYSAHSVLMTIYGLFDTEGNVSPVNTHQYESGILLNTIWVVFR